jgi:3-dehydroquinate dehydratase/shikimate dehydrogenase
MTKIAAAIMVSNLDQALCLAARAAELGADLVEYRVDNLAESPEGAKLVTTLIEKSPLPCIITCRASWEGGECDVDDQTRVSFLENACLNGELRPAYLDFELASHQKSFNIRQKVELMVDHPGQIREVDTGLILSSHDFDKRPVDLYQRVEAMSHATACRVIKVAWMARSLRDNIEAFEILQSQYKPTIALCMGEAGLASRVLAKKFGALLTFAAIDGQPGTAPGQPTISQLKQLYRWDSINAQTKVYGVIGCPVGHSMSPAIFNAAFAQEGYDGVYLPMLIEPSYESFKATVLAWLDMPSLHFKGASVTIPHKQNLMRFVTEQGGEVEQLAQRIGAANTLTVREDGSLYASNSDYAGALDAVVQNMGIAREEVKDLRVAVIGAGGAARAIVAGFSHYGATVVVYNRTLAKAQQLADEFTNPYGKVVAAPMDKLCDSCCQVFINCTPLGMHPNVETSPLAQDFGGYGPGTVVFDTVYNPRNTLLLRQARAAGCLTIQGTEMFVRQAAAQYQLWTGQEAPVPCFSRVLLEKLG